MRVGTKSLLFGVHQGLWHPITVWLAWRRLYSRCPTFWETVAIVIHDWGYWGVANMDGEEGTGHPRRGAELIFRWYCYWHRRPEDRPQAFRLFLLIMGHSNHYARCRGIPTSALCAPDKLSVAFDPEWWYILRARLSGEVWEYIQNSPLSGASPKQWFRWYKEKTKQKYLK